jgi:hypothetical protein
MDRLKEHIKRGKSDYFENQAIPQGHQLRFKAKWEKNNTSGNKVKRLLPIAIGIAATVALIVVFQPNDEEHLKEGPPVLGDVSPEMEKVELYFSARLEASDLPLKNNDPLLNRQLLQLETLDKEYQNLRLVLQQNFGNQRVIDAMINNYQMRIRIMEQMKKYQEIKNNRINHAPNEL